MGERRARVEVHRSGGFAGISRTAVADTDQLGAQQTGELLELLDHSRADEHGGPSPRPSTRGADRFQYDFTIEQDDRTESFVRDEAELTPGQQRLLRWVLANGAAAPG